MKKDAKKKKVETVDGGLILYHILQKQIIEPYEGAEPPIDPPAEVKFMIEQLLLWGGVWFKPQTYKLFPVLRPYAVRDNSCKVKGSYTWGESNDEGFIKDDNSSIKDMPGSLTIESRVAEMNGKRLGNSFTASHVWRMLKNKPGVLAPQWERTNSFIPNLVWIPKEIAKLTDREGSYAQRFIQYISWHLYRDIDMYDPMLNEIWDELREPSIKPVSEFSLKDLNYFEHNEGWLHRWGKALHNDYEGIIGILRGMPSTGMKIYTSKYAPTLEAVSRTLAPAKKAYLEKWLKANMRDDFEMWSQDLSEISGHIMGGCRPHTYADHLKGLIVSDDTPSGDILRFVKDGLRYGELAAAGKVKEITVGKGWPLGDFNECWERLLSEARSAKDGLLVINVDDIRLFDHCWCIKQLAKQEDPILGFNGHVLLVIRDGLSWDRVRAYARGKDSGEYDAMMQFYYRVTFNIGV